ncbi:solute carrier family 2, facilitated glucose transporter member 9-like [Archocentrus centrarchus]|uniref:solute carrier family 2, facilitated glucose transporter member 9-like n=1 Tax=Archocentrus centrarchus TaxID=63155 RepID=UPI0011EA3019|nr:solute carrier family 2, facilitated glucose transporter member 9-like [Archocentrus centrarchus]
MSVMTSPSVFIKELVNKTCEHRYGLSLEPWQLSLIWSFTVSIYCIGGLLGSLAGGPLGSKFGRKRCLWLNNFVAMFGAVLMLLSKTAMSFEMIMAGRFLYGINSGVSLSLHAMYLIECTPWKLRVIVGVTVGFFLSLGKFTGQLLGISELLGTETLWPWLLGFSGFTALFQLLTLFFLPESPSFLLLDRGDRQACEQALKQLWGNKDYSRELEEMLKEKVNLQGVRNYSVLELIQNKTVRWQLMTIFVIFTTLQLCGANAVYFYSFDVFRAAGIPEDKLRYAALGTGLCEVSTTVACFTIIERTGKKALLFRAYTGMSVVLILLTITVYLQTQVSWMPYCSMILIFLFIFFFASGPVGVTPPLPGEVFAQPFRPAAYTIACTLSWAGLFVLGMLFPIIVEKLDYFCFLIFLFFCLCCTIYVKFNVPETKNKTPLEIAAEFEKMRCKPKLKNFTEKKVSGIISYETKL